MNWTCKREKYTEIQSKRINVGGEICLKTETCDEILLFKCEQINFHRRAGSGAGTLNGGACVGMVDLIFKAGIQWAARGVVTHDHTRPMAHHFRNKCVERDHFFLWIRTVYSFTLVVGFRTPIF